MAGGFPMNRSSDVTYSWSTRWQRELDSFEKRLNEALPPSKYAPVDEGDIRSYGRGAGALVLLKLAQDYMELEIQRRDFDIRSRVSDIAAQVRDQLQPGQEVQVHVAINRAPDIRVTATAIEPVRDYPQLRAADSRPQPVWSESAPKGSANSSETATVRVRKPFPAETEQCLIQEVSSSKSVTTQFAIAERNETLEVRHLQMPAGSVSQNEVVKEAPQPPRLPERPLLEAERRALEERIASTIARAKAEADAARKTERQNRDDVSTGTIHNHLP